MFLNVFNLTADNFSAKKHTQKTARYIRPFTSLPALNGLHIHTHTIVIKPEAYKRRLFSTKAQSIFPNKWSGLQYISAGDEKQVADI